MLVDPVLDLLHCELSSLKLTRLRVFKLVLEHELIEVGDTVIRFEKPILVAAILLEYGCIHCIEIFIRHH